MSSTPVSSVQHSRRKPLAACIATLFALSASSVAHAAVDWQVVNCKDDGTTGTFRWAAANANGANADTINLTTITDFSACSPGLTGEAGAVAHTLLLGSTISLATGGVTINGPGPSNLAISAVQQNFRAISAPGDLTINNLQIKYASPNKATSVYYGGCVEASTNLTLTNVELTHCYLANTGSVKGGAVSSFGGQVKMTNVDITKSTATSTTSGNAFGGVVYAYNSVLMYGSSIYPGTGGVSGAYVTGGTGSALGGAVHSHRANYKAYLKNSTISTSKASVSSSTGGSANGGAVWAKGGVTLYSSTISGASATTTSTAAAKNAYGGGAYSGGAAIVYESSVTGNGASTTSSSGAARGGGVFSKGLTDAKYSYITANSAQFGGGVYTSSGFISQYSYFWANGASKAGGAVDMPAGNATVRGTTVTYGSGGLCCSGLDFHAGGAGTVSIEQSTIAHNGGSSSIYSRAASTKIYNSTVVYNGSSGDVASGIYIGAGNAGSTATIVSNLLSSNTYGASSTKNDLAIGSGITLSGNNNLIRSPGTGVPGDTITGKCPLLYPGSFTFFDKQFQFPIRHEVKSPASNTGSNPLILTADQRGGEPTATSPARVSGEPGTTALPDIGAYEVDETDEIFDSRLEGCN
jgi:hypothetical protein